MHKKGGNRPYFGMARFLWYLSQNTFSGLFPGSRMNAVKEKEEV